MLGTNKETIIATLKALQPQLQNDGIAHLAIFGSFARGTAGYLSDIDLYATLDGGKKISWSDLMRFERELGEKLGRQVDLCTSLKPWISGIVEKEKIDVF